MQHTNERAPSASSDKGRRLRSLWVFVLGSLIAITISGLVTGVAMGGNAETFGPIPEDAWLEDGSMDRRLLPDFVEATGRDGSIVGYVRALELFPERGEPTEGPIPVVDRNLQLVGHMVPGYGFVPVGTDAEDIEKVPVTTEES